MNNFKFRHEQFEGPLDLLLQLIESKQLNITEISLSKVADDYIAHLENNPNITLHELSDFLIISARLLILKSRTLLPYLVIEEEEDGESLAKQLKIYKEYLEASKTIQKFWNNKARLYKRQPSKIPRKVKFSPSSNITLENMLSAAGDVAQRLEIPMLPTQTIKRVFNIKQKIHTLLALIEKVKQASFSTFVQDAKDRAEIVVTFLALLELVKQDMVQVLQDDLFGDLVITNKL